MRLQSCLTLMSATAGPLLLVVALRWYAPQIGWFGLTGIGLLGAVAATAYLSRKLQSTAESLAQGYRILQETLTTGNLPPQLSASEQSLLGETHHSAISQFSSQLSHRICELLAANSDHRKNATRYQSILATMTEGVLLIEADGHIRFCNSSAGKLLGRPVREVEGRLLWEVLRNPELEAALEQALTSGEETRQELELQRTKCLVALSTVPLGSTSNSGMVVVLHDITELRRLERMRREFVSNVSHELKTPLTAIQAYSDTLLDGGLEDADNSRLFVERIQEQAERLRQMIQDMLRLARIESQADAFQLQPVQVREVIENCVDARLAVARARDIQLTYQDETPEDSEVLADEEGLRTIFENLINNALNYTPEGGEVNVHCWIENAALHVEVKDNGIGIAREHHDRIFERFYRVDRSRARGVGGTGLGLAIVKHCVSVFQGQIQVESQVGRGTTFRVCFPLLQASTIPSSTTKAGLEVLTEPVPTN